MRFSPERILKQSLLAPAAFLIAWFAFVPKALPQGCVCAKQSGPALLGQGYLEGGHIQGSVGYRWLHSDRHFTGDHEDVVRQQEGSEVINDVNYVDLFATYAITKRFSVTLTVPFQVANRSQVVRSNDVQRTILTRFSTQSAGLGDMRLTAGAWLLNPETHVKENIAIGLGVKFPTGEDAARDTFQVYDPVSKQIVARDRTVDQSIQPGDGGWGAVVDVMAFTELFKNLNLFAAGTYLFNPKEMNGVPTYRSNPYEAVMSVSDQYLGRVGLTYNVLPNQGLTLSLAGRIEGVPVYDAIGGSDGFRRPGFAISIEPGLIWSKDTWTVSVSAPVALYRNREQSVPDKQLEAATGVPRHGDAAFADFMILAGITKRF